MRFNSLMSTHFAGRPCVLELRDDGRHRIQRVFDIGELNLVGISDGTDAWVCSVHGFERFGLQSLLNVEVKHRDTSKTDNGGRTQNYIRRAKLRAVLDTGDAVVDR